jgi:hypothetical protein
MSLPLMTESTSSGREPGICTLGSILRFAAIRLQVRVEVFTTRGG